MRLPAIRQLAFLLLLALTAALPAAQVPVGFTETQLASGIDSPTSMEVTPDGRVFIACQGGTIRVVKNGAMLATPLMTLANTAMDERGLSCIKLDPNFASNGHFYVTYTTQWAGFNSPATNEVQRYTVSPPTADTCSPSTKVTIFTLDTESQGWHLGTALDVGTDGKLYVTTGEAGSALGSKSLLTTHGKVLRINPDGSIPTDNPFYAVTSGTKRAIFATGFRNPFTMTIDSQAATPMRIFAMDVGGGSFEEINLVEAGKSYGYPDSEGPAGGADTSPWFHYAHGSGTANGNCTIAGLFYRKTQFPAQYQGKFFTGDYSNGWIKTIDLTTKATEVFATGLTGLVHLDVDAQGNLYYLQRGSTDWDGGSGPGFQNGSLYRVSYAAPASPVTLVDWFGNYAASGDPALRNDEIYAPAQGPMNLGAGPNDWLAGCVLSDVTALNPASGQGYSTGMASAVFFGGVRLEKYNGGFSFKWAEVWTGGPANPNDELYYGGPDPSRGWDFRYWKQNGFLNGGAAGTITFNASSTLEVLGYRGGDGVPGNNSGNVRFVVRDGGQFWVSQDLGAPQAGTGNFTLTDPNSRGWAAYHPSAPYDLAFAPAGGPAPSFAPRTFSNVTAIGYLHSNEQLTVAETVSGAKKAGFTAQRFRASGLVATGTTPVLTTLIVSPATATVPQGTSQTFTVAGRDQFGNTVSPLPAITWTSGSGGSITSAGVFTAINASGTVVVKAAANGVNGTAIATLAAPPAQVATPSISPTGGSFTGPVWVQLAVATPGAEIRYTVDGSTPSAGSTLYTGPFQRTGTTTVRAIGRKTGMSDSAVASSTITITGSTPYGLPYRAPLAALTVGTSPAGAPATLSQTGVFSSLATLTPAAGIVPFTVNSPLWSDGAAKQRWIALPTGTAVTFAANGEWTFPAGTVLIKHFDMDLDDGAPTQLKRLETRLLVIDPAGPGTSFGVTYRWRADNTNADLVASAGASEVLTIALPGGGTRQQTWAYPSHANCMQCHNAPAGVVLGPKTRQLNGTYAYPGGASDNQLRTWNYLGMFASSLSEAAIPGYAKLVAVDAAAAPLVDRVRSYLDANCALCHRPGAAPTAWDARWDTPLASQGIVRGPVAVTLGIADAQVVAPNDLARSILDVRMHSLSTAVRMPPVGSSVVDSTATTTVAAWIASLPRFTSLAVTPAAPTPMTVGQTRSFSAAALDQFGAAFAPAPSVTWSTTLGSINAAGLYTANAVGIATITAQATYDGWTRSTSVQVTVTSAGPLPGDLNSDGVVNAADLNLVSANFGKTSASAGWNPQADANGDGLCNIADLALVTANYTGP